MKIILITLLVFSGWNAQADDFSVYKKGKIEFLKHKKFSEADFSASPYQFKPDPAHVRYKVPLTGPMRTELTLNSFSTLTQEEIDQIYIRLTSGPITPGQYEGKIVMNAELRKHFEKVTKVAFAGARLATIAEGLRKQLPQCADPIVCVGEYIWGGKQIYRTSASTGVTELRNAIDPAAALYINKLLLGETAEDGGLDPFKQTFIGKEKRMIFPAKVYCGQSLFEHGRESILIDYAYTDDFKRPVGTSGMGYVNGLDDLGGRGQLEIRDEVRMVRDGLYLGRAYINKSFVLNFVLNNAKADTGNGDKLTADKCYNGKHARL